MVRRSRCYLSSWVPVSWSKYTPFPKFTKCLLLLLTFSKAPWTGKSSFARAIAGVFGLDIYCISLADRTLTEEHLGIMFSSLPRRCVVLLEDIDSAGLTKRQENYAKPADDAATKIGAEKVEPEALIGFDQGNLMLTTSNKTRGGSHMDLFRGLALTHTFCPRPQCCSGNSESRLLERIVAALIQ